MAGNEWYDKHKKDVTAALNKAKAAAKEDALACSLVKMHDGTYLLCIHATASKSAQMVKEAKTAGGKVVSAGILYNGAEGLTFEVSEGAPSVRKQFGEAANEATGRALLVTVVAATVPPPPPPPAPTGDGGAAAFKERVGALNAALGRADAATQAKLKPLLIEAVKLGKEGNFAGAETVLRQLERGLASPVPTPSPDARGPFLEQLRGLQARYKQHLQGAPPNKDVLEKTMTAIVQAAKENDFAKAGKLAAALDKALPTGPGAALPAWQAALAPVQKAIAGLRDKLRQTDDPDLAVIADDGLTRLAKSLDGEVAASLKEVDGTPPEGRAAAWGRAAPVLAKYRQYLEADPLLGEIDANPFGVTVAARETLGRALEAVDKMAKA